MSTRRFTVLHKDYGRLVEWSRFFPREECSLTDRIMAEKFYRSQGDPGRMPGGDGQSLKLTTEGASPAGLGSGCIPDAGEAPTAPDPGAYSIAAML